MKIPKAILHGAAVFGALLVVPASTVGTRAVAQDSAWPDSPDVVALKGQLAAAEGKHGSDHPDDGELLLEVANALREQGAYVPATRYVERALAITEKAKGPEHFESALLLDKLGGLYLLEGDAARARAALMRARPALLQQVGPKNPGYGLFLMHLGKALSQTGENEEAKEVVEQALVAFGEELSHAAHEWTGANLEMGLLFMGLRKYRLAEQQLVYALTVRSEALSFGPRDEGLFYMAPVRNALGQLYVTVGLLDQAESLLQDALDAYEKKYGKDHALTEDVLVNLAALYDGRQDASKAREYADRAQAVHRKSAGYSHAADQPLRKLARATPAPCPPQGQDLQSCGAGVDSPDRP